MPLTRLTRQVQAVLTANGIAYSELPDGYSVRFSSAVVRIHLGTFGSQTIVQFRSDVLSNVEQPLAVVHAEVNGLNAETTFGRWVYYGDDRVVALEGDLLGDHLQDAELMTSLATLARLADGHDDRLQARIGGEKAVE